MASETRNVLTPNRAKLNNYFQAQQIDLPKSRDLQRLRRCFERGEMDLTSMNLAIGKGF